MPDILEVAHDDIRRLSPTDLHRLLECLLDNELIANGIPRTAANVMLDVSTPDGGEDGLVYWGGEPPGTLWIPNRRTLFQSKSGPFSSFSSEPFVRNSHPRRLKPRVSLNFENGGAFVYFCGGRTLSAEARARAIAQTRTAIREVLGDDREVLIYDSNDIKRWVNDYLAAISLVFAATGKDGLNAFSTSRHWSGFRGHETAFESSDQTRAHIQRLRDRFIGRQVVERIVGLSGLGKTRIALEAFRPPDDASQAREQGALSGSVVYVVAADESELISKVAALEKRGVSGTIIVDDCSQTLHDSLARHIQHSESKLNLLSLDYHVDEELASTQPGTFELRTTPAETIRAIIKRNHPSLGERDLDVVTSYADGFPKIAAMLRDVPLEEDTAMAPLTEPRLTERLLWGRNASDDTARRVIEACSLFIHLGFEGSFKYQRHYVADHICRVDQDVFYSKCQLFKDRRVLDPIGDFVRVSPLPLAIRLSEKWWREIERDDAQRLFADPDMPGDLKAALGRQFTNLSGVERAQEIVRRLTEPNAPFGRAEVLNTQQGSRVFRSLAEVNPEAALEALMREFGSMPEERLREDVGPGRRSLIWALEVIVFNERLFLRAARLLSLLALAENEKIGNNATAQYLQLFQPVLAGTEAFPVLRIAEVDRCLRSSDERLVRLAVRALGRVISNRSTGRVMGAEKQGRSVLKDWFPSTYADLYWYFDAAVERLIPFAQRADELGDVARKRLGESLRLLLSYGRIDTVERAIREVTSVFRAAWPEALESVRTMIRHGLQDTGLQSEEGAAFIARVRALPSLLRPQNESEQLRLSVSIPPYGNMAQNTDGSYIDLNEVEAASVAGHYANSLERWEQALAVVSTGEQRQGYTFGHRIGELVDASIQQQYVDLAFEALDGRKENGNPAVLCGLLAALKPRNRELVDRTLDRIADSTYSFNFIVYLTACSEPTERDLDRLNALLLCGRLSPASFRRLVYGRVLGRFKGDVVCAFLRPLLDHGLEGVMAALQIANMYVKTEDEWDACDRLLRNILRMPGLLSWHTTDTMDNFALTQTIKKYLERPTDEAELARHLIYEIIAICRQPRFNVSLYEVMQEVVAALFQSYPEVVWPIVRETFLEGDLSTEHYLIEAMKRNLTMAQGPKSAFLLLPDDKLLLWCREQPQLGPRLVLGSIPLFTYDGESLRVPQLVTALVTEYGSDKRVLSAMAGNLESFGNVGSFVPAYEQRLAFVQQFVDSPVPEVGAWATTYVNAYAERVKSQEKRDAEHREGILTAHFADELPEGQIPDVYD
jgi:hypothetical protein